MRQLIEVLRDLKNAVNHLAIRTTYDEWSRLRTRVDIVDDGSIRVYDASKTIDLFEVLREFSWTSFNLAEASKLLSELKPARGASIIDLVSYSIPGGGVVNVDKGDLDGWSAIVATVRASYASEAAAGIRVRWLYSQDGANFDSPEDAEAMGNYTDLSFAAGATRQRTVQISILTPYIRIQIVNLDTANTATVDMLSLPIR